LYVSKLANEVLLISKISAVYWSAVLLPNDLKVTPWLFLFGRGKIANIEDFIFIYLVYLFHLTKTICFDWRKYLFLLIVSFLLLSNQLSALYVHTSSTCFWFTTIYWNSLRIIDIRFRAIDIYFPIDFWAAPINFDQITIILDFSTVITACWSDSLLVFTCLFWFCWCFLVELSNINFTFFIWSSFYKSGFIINSFLKSNTLILFDGVGFYLFLIMTFTSKISGRSLQFLVINLLIVFIRYPPKCPFIGFGSLSIT